MSLNKFLPNQTTYIICLMVVSFLSSCSTIQITERGESQHAPAFSIAQTTRTVIPRKQKTKKDQNSNNTAQNNLTNTPKASNDLAESRISKLPENLSNTDGKFQSVVKISNDTFLLCETKSQQQASSRAERKPLQKTKSQLVKSQVISTGLSIIQPLKLAISKKQKSISTAIQMSNKNSVLPDSDSPFLKWVAFMMGVLIIVTGIIILGVMISQGFYYFDELDLLFGLFAVVLFLAAAGLYFLASHGFDDLEDHSLVYQIGFYLTVFSPFLIFIPALIGLPMLIFAAVFENWE